MLPARGHHIFDSNAPALSGQSKIYAKDHGAFKEAYLALRGDREVCAVVVQEDGLGLKYCMPMVRPW